MIAARIAIWNKNRIVIMFTVGVWLVNLAFFVDGKSVLPARCPVTEPLINMIYS